MTIEEAIRILDPESSKEALLPYAYDSHQRRKVVAELRLTNCASGSG